MIPLSASDPSCGMLHFSLTVTKCPMTFQKRHNSEATAATLATTTAAPETDVDGSSQMVDDARLSSDDFNPPTASPEDGSVLNHKPDLSVRRKTTDRRFSGNPLTEEETSPFVVGSLKFRRRVFHQRNLFEKSGAEFDSGKPKKFEISAPPNRKLSVPVELSSSLSNNFDRPKIEAGLSEAAAATAAASTSRGPSRNPSPNKRTSSGKIK